MLELILFLVSATVSVPEFFFLTTTQMKQESQATALSATLNSLQRSMLHPTLPQSLVVSGL
jgi:hypothetical protein